MKISFFIRIIILNINNINNKFNFRIICLFFFWISLKTIFGEKTWLRNFNYFFTWNTIFIYLLFLKFTLLIETVFCLFNFFLDCKIIESISLEEFKFILLFPSDKFKFLFWFFKDKLNLGFILEDEFWLTHKFLPSFIL